MALHKQKFLITKADGDTKGVDAILKAIEGLPDNKWQVDIFRYVKRRSNPQNNLMHKYFDIIADETGNSLDRVKNILKALFLTTEMLDEEGNRVCNPKTGEVVTYVRDTSDLNTIEAATFTEEIRLWAMDWGIYLPNPDEMREINFKKQ